MFLKGVVTLKKKSLIPFSRFMRRGAPWVFSNELQKIDTSLEPGSWVSLESAEGHSLGYGHFNPHSLIAFRLFERAPFRSEEQTRAFFFKRLDHAWCRRTLAYPELSRGGRSCRLAFGESDGVPGLVIDLFESGKGPLAVIQCHSAGADQFIFWGQQWLAERLGIDRGVIRNDIEVRNREHAKLEVQTWGDIPREYDDVYAVEGGLRFYFDLLGGQKTGFFYDHRDNRLAFAQRVSGMKPSGDDPLAALDAFSYVGAWGLALARAHPQLKVVCLDSSAKALEYVNRNAHENNLHGRVETLKADYFKDKELYRLKKFDVVVSDPPAMSSSAKNAGESRRAHERCFAQALELLAPRGLAVLSACSFHLKWEEFFEVCAQTDQELLVTGFGAQAADHPVLASLPETRYLKSVIVERLF